MRRGGRGGVRRCEERRREVGVADRGRGCERVRGVRGSGNGWWDGEGQI